MTEWTERTSNIKVGDKVAFKASFLRNTGRYTGDTHCLRGTVTDLQPLGERMLATVDWHNGEEPQKVIVGNLSQVTQHGIADE